MKKNDTYRTLTCLDFETADLPTTGKCCSACHDERDKGYGMCDYEPEPRKNNNINAEVCCTFKLAWHTEKSRNYFAKAIVAKRKRK